MAIRKCACGLELKDRTKRCKECDAARKRAKRADIAKPRGGKVRVRKVSVVKMTVPDRTSPGFVVTVEHDGGAEPDFFVGPFLSVREADFYARLYLDGHDHKHVSSAPVSVNDVFIGFDGGRSCAGVCGYCETYSGPNIKRHVWSELSA